MKKLILAVAYFIAMIPLVIGQAVPDMDLLENQLHSVEWQFAGPTRGGRSTAVSGIPGKTHTFFMGTTGGGIWQTDDAGHSWENVSDGEIDCGSIGSITCAPTAPYVVYAGTGSGCPRGNVSVGCGVYRSDDGGDTWRFAGLPNAGQIPRIVVHPGNENIVYAAVLGNPFRKNEERGVYKSTDGGKSWIKSLYLNDSTGAVDLAIHPENPRILYAGMWRVERKPWTLIDGSSSGGLYKSTDGGTSWQRVLNGLPEGVVGRTGIAISPVNPDRIWILQATADEETSGLYRSDDGGRQFNRICRDHKLRQRAWYYTHVFPDPQSEHTVYVCNVGFYKSIDGGKTFDTRFRVPHGDTHDLWINPDNPSIMINANDGGATISLNGGRTWSPQDNQPTPEFYRLTTDDRIPFRMYGGQQDNSTISIPSRRSWAVHRKTHWRAVGGGESADIAVHPTDPDIVYATNYSGIITRKDMRTGKTREIGAYPHYTEGTAMRDLKYRWQWNFPIRISRHDPDILVMASNYVHVSKDEGQNWEVVSPDLSRNIDAYLGIPGGPVQFDATGVEVYGTIFALEESPDEPGTWWAGTDDGRIHIMRDWSGEWQDISSDLLPEEATINHIHLPKGSPNTAYIAAYHYRYGDFSPYILKTKNGGRSWHLLTNGENGIPGHHFVRAVVADPEQDGLLYAGTEFGVYISFDDGKNWEPMQFNLPVTPVTDMEVKGNILAISTQGRGFWTLDGLHILRSFSDMRKKREATLVAPGDIYRSDFRDVARIPVYLPEGDSVEGKMIEIRDPEGMTIVTFKNTPDKHLKEKKLELQQGLNIVAWDLRYPAPDMVEDLVMMDMRYPGRGPTAIPGNYRAVLLDANGRVLAEEGFSILPDPDRDIPLEKLKAGFELASDISQLITQSQTEIMQLRSVRKQINEIIENANHAGYPVEVRERGKKIVKKAKLLEDMIYQDRIEVSQDEINYPRKFTNHLIRLYRVVLGADEGPTGGQLERWEDIRQEYAPFKLKYNQFMESELENFEQYLGSINLPMIITKLKK